MQLVPKQWHFVWHILITSNYKPLFIIDALNHTYIAEWAESLGILNDLQPLSQKQEYRCYLVQPLI